MAPTFDFQKYRYTPTLVGAVVSIIIFSILAALHTWQMLRSGKRFLSFIVIGAICEVVGYGTRIASHYDTESWAAFIIQGVYILVGPLFFAATIYMMLGRTIRLAGGEQNSFISPRWITRIFVTADISTLIVQGLGASIMGTMQVELAIAGSKVIIAGLAMQVSTFCAFVVVAANFHWRMRKNPIAITTPESQNWRKVLYILYTVSSIILLRCIFRLVEYAMGNAAYPMAHEWCLYVFDTTLMVIVLVLLLILQPAKYVPRRNRKFSESDLEELASEEKKMQNQSDTSL